MRVLLLCVVVVLFSASDVHAYDTPSFHFKGTSYNHASKTSVVYAKRALQGFNFRVWLSNQMTMGLQAWDANNGSEIPVEPHFGLEYPAGSGFEHLYGAGPVVAALIDGVRAVSEAYNGNNTEKYFLPEMADTLRDRMWVTSINNLSEPNRRAFDDDADGRIDEDELDGCDNDGDWLPTANDIGSDGLPDSLETGCKGGYDRVYNPDPVFDNYDPDGWDSCRATSPGEFVRRNDKDYYTENNGLADHGEPHVDEDYAAVSEHDIYCSATDTFRNPIKPGHRPLGIKVWQRSYAWSGSFAQHILPLEYAFINVGNKILEDVYVGFFADADIGPVNSSGYTANNYSAYMANVRTAYIHNPIQRGSTPLGITVLQTPRSLEDLTYTYQWHDFNEPGTNDSLLYSWMSCEEFGGTNCIAADQPAAGLTDARFFLSFGPIASVSPGDTLKLSLAVISGNCVENCPGSLRENAGRALIFSQRDYAAPVAFSSPNLTVEGGRSEITIHWGGSTAGIDPRSIWDDHDPVIGALPDTHWRRQNPPAGHTAGGRIFEGYRLYRSRDFYGREGTFKLLKEFDLTDDEFGDNTGIDTIYIDTNVVPTVTYWYAVTSFGISDYLIVDVPNSNGGTRVDTIYTSMTESPILQNARKISLPTGVEEDAGVPADFRLHDAYPNPFNPKTRISFDLAAQSNITLRIYDLLGRAVAELGEGLYAPGFHEVAWDATGQPSGVYMVRFIASETSASGHVYSETKKVVLAK